MNRRGSSGLSSMRVLRMWWIQSLTSVRWWERTAMASGMLRQLPAASSTSSALAKVRRDYNDRLSLSEAADLVGKLLAQWPRAPTEEPYMLALAAALRAYPRCVATAAIEPATGVPREKTYGPGPTVADVVGWCDREVAWMIRAIDADNNPKLLAEKLAELPNPPDRSHRPTLEELKRKHGPSWGITKEDPVFTGSNAA